MALVDYSDSDSSDPEISSAPKPSVKPSKCTFRKVVDPSHPGKIKVSLPQPTQQSQRDQDENPPKRIKLGGGSLSDFKSFLPAPKRGDLGSGNAARRNGLTAGGSLKTGAAPGFSRETEFSDEMPDSHLADLNRERDTGHDAIELGGLPTKNSSETKQKHAEEVKLVGKPLMFKPLSVARNPGKKKKKLGDLSTASSVQGMSSGSSTTISLEPTPQKPKVSLFSMSSEPSDAALSGYHREYQPMIYGKNIDDGMESEMPTTIAGSTYDGYTNTSQNTTSSTFGPIPGAQSLNDIASDLNLSASDRRQLFGRQKGRASQAMKIMNFNTDEEYRHNEELRAAGEQVVHNPVRAIAPGKHSLKQLVNAAANQKEALEESFAKGKSNRAEASSRYGW